MSATGFPACSTKSEFLVGWAGEPVHKRLIENGARSQLYPNSKFELTVTDGATGIDMI